MADRTSRETVTRAEAARPRNWDDDSPLPVPTPQPGWAFRWIRVGYLGNTDDANMNKRFRDGWVPLKASEHPELAQLADSRKNTGDTIEIGGLILCKMPEAEVRARNEHFARKSEQQVQSVNAALAQAQHPAMPMTVNMSSRIGGPE